MLKAAQGLPVEFLVGSSNVKSPTLKLCGKYEQLSP